MITAISPGTYDPVTLGHVDVITRAAGIFDRVVVGVVANPQHKAPMFSLEERVDFLREALGDLENVEVDVFSELQMNQLNRTLAPDIETVYVMASPQVSFVSSSGVKEIAAFGGNVEELVPEPVARRMADLYPQARPGAPVSPQE
jgi:pantetheine-phosphate adenylyltransferase